MITQVEIARRIGLDVSSVNKILNRRQGPVFRRETIQRVFRVARELGYDFGRLKFQHRRKSPRKQISLGAEIKVFQKDGSLFDQGSATIKDISACGACISDVTLPSRSLPAEPFSVSLKPVQKPLEGVELAGHIVRLQAGQGSFGIEFQKLDASLERKLRKVAKA